MIKIRPYTELPNRDEIFNLYLFMAAMSMPFFPEDIFPEGYFCPDGKTKESLTAFPRRARKRTNAYKLLLAKHKPYFSGHPTAKREEDALLAEALIREFSPALHDFLYKGMTDGHVSPQALRLLLTSPMDRPSIKKDRALYTAFMSGGGDAKILLEHVFRYEVFSTREEIHHLVSLLGVDICPYCNRLYITTAMRNEGAPPVRPELDHYRSKSQYPFFALSILNLIPSCGVCNHIKGDKTQEILYPYVEEMGKDYCFRTEPIAEISYLTSTRVSKEDFDLTFKQMRDTMSTAKKIRAQNSIKLLQLEALYSAHREYVSDMIFQRYIFTDSMIQDLMRQFPALFKSEEEVRSMLLMMELNQEKWGKRPLAKLTHDITVELDELYAAASISKK